MSHNNQNLKDLSLLPQYVHYLADGKGRDIYISSNSGGFSKYHSHGLDTKETYPAKVKFKFSYPQLHSAPLVYRSDGSGRDSYILREAGGLRDEFKTLSAFKLEDILRTPSEHLMKYIENRKNKNIVWVSKKELEMNKANNRIKKNVVKRLYDNSFDGYMQRKENRNNSKGFDEKLSVKENKYPFNKTLCELKTYNFNHFIKKEISNENVSFKKSESTQNFCPLIHTGDTNNNIISSEGNSKKYYNGINKSIYHTSKLSMNLKNQKASFYDKPQRNLNDKKTFDDYLKRKEIFG